jgi:hypothetical protein
VTERLGVDIGGVLIDRVNDDTDTSFFGDNYLHTTAVPGAFDAIKQLSDRRFGSQIHLVSKCGPRVEQKSRDWLAHHDFFRTTGVNPANLHFCRRRQDKAPISETLGLTHFIDDRLEVLGYLKSVPNLYLFHPTSSEVEKHARHLQRVYRAESWDEILIALI